MLYRCIGKDCHHLDNTGWCGHANMKGMRVERGDCCCPFSEIVVISSEESLPSFVYQGQTFSYSELGELI